MKKLLFAVVAFAMVGCTKSNPVVCAVQDSVVSIVSGAVTSELACKNLDAVKADIAVQVGKLNLCKPAAAAPAAPAITAQAVTAQGAVGNVICAPVIDVLMGGVLSTIPATWGCTGGLPADKLKAAALAACLKAI